MKYICIPFLIMFFAILSPLRVDARMPAVDPEYIVEPIGHQNSTTPQRFNFQNPDDPTLNHRQSSPIQYRERVPASHSNSTWLFVYLVILALSLPAFVWFTISKKGKEHPSLIVEETIPQQNPENIVNISDYRKAKTIHEMEEEIKKAESRKRIRKVS